MISRLRVDGSVKRGRPHKTWAQRVNDDVRLSSLKAEDALDRVKWRATMQRLTHKWWILTENGY